MSRQTTQLTVDALLQLKTFFDENFQATLSSLNATDSDRLVRNKINGFVISLQDRLFKLKPKNKCQGCGQPK